MNQVSIYGRLFEVGEVRYVQGGNKEVRIATITDSQGKNKDGTWKDSIFHKVVCFDQLSKKIGLAKKGDLVHVHGKITERKWVDKSGEKKSVREIMADQLFIEAGNTSSMETINSVAKGVSAEGDFEDDVPF